jgi:hypothetical protein
MHTEGHRTALLLLIVDLQQPKWLNVTTTGGRIIPYMTGPRFPVGPKPEQSKLAASTHCYRVILLNVVLTLAISHSSTARYNVMVLKNSEGLTVSYQPAN